MNIGALIFGLCAGAWLGANSVAVGNWLRAIGALGCGT